MDSLPSARGRMVDANTNTAVIPSGNAHALHSERSEESLFRSSQARTEASSLSRPGAGRLLGMTGTAFRIRSRVRMCFVVNVHQLADGGVRIFLRSGKRLVA